MGSSVTTMIIFPKLARILNQESPTKHSWHIHRPIGKRLLLWGRKQICTGTRTTYTFGIEWHGARVKEWYVQFGKGVLEKEQC